MKYLIERQAYPGGPFQFLAQHGEPDRHAEHVQSIIGDWRTVSEFTNSPRPGGGFIFVIVREDGSRERYKTRIEK